MTEPGDRNHREWVGTPGFFSSWRKSDEISVTLLLQKLSCHAESEPRQARQERGWLGSSPSALCPGPPAGGRPSAIPSPGGRGHRRTWHTGVHAGGPNRALSKDAHELLFSLVHSFLNCCSDKTPHERSVILELVSQPGGGSGLRGCHRNLYVHDAVIGSEASLLSFWGGARSRIFSL